jgi:hypothetical protein
MSNINRLIESAYRQLGYTRGKYRYKKQTKQQPINFKSSLSDEAVREYIKQQPIHGGALRYMYDTKDWVSGVRPLVSRKYYNSAEMK